MIEAFFGFAPHPFVENPMVRFALSRWCCLTLLLVACSGCIPQKFSSRDLEDAKAHVTKRLETVPPRSRQQPPDSRVVHVQWVQTPYAAAGSGDLVSVFGEVETIDNHKVRRLFTCNARLVRRENRWTGPVKTQEQANTWDDVVKRAETMK